ncbi:unnamed protein product [Hymenolepis diminuta]|uniref:Phorbol-ester/DAG-type domain-containing protein n=1 Tax=Hymenolepis diminuta TaxID=6216 RepID=A0A158QDT0_HYMDI|nr:unnamed protein product [Hymenolepis diminuta]
MFLVYNLQREAPKPFPVECTEPLEHVPEQYGSAYHGPLSRQGTEELLDGQPSGAYLIRDSQRADGAYTLAIRFDDSTKNYKLFYDPSKKLHYVGEKKFESVDLLVADGLIYLYIETRGADILQKLSEASNYEHSPYYRIRYHTVNAIPPSNRPSVSTVSGNKIVPPRRQSSLELLDGHNHWNQSNNTFHHQASPKPPTPISSRQSSTNQQPVGHNSTVATGTTTIHVSLDTDEGISNGGVLLTDSIDKKLLKGEKPARSTSLPFAKPSCNDHSKHDATDVATAVSSGSSSGHASLKSRQSDKDVFAIDDTETQRKKFIGGGNVHHRTLASTLPVSLDGAMSPQIPTSPLPPKSVPLSSHHLVVPDVEKAHNFRVHTFRGPHWCDFCTHFIWGLVSQGVKCTDCGFQAHKRCSISVPNDCLPDMKRLKRVFGVDLTSLVRAENRFLAVLQPET